MTHLHELQSLAWAIAEDSGFHEGDEVGEDERSRAKILALIHSEVSEALEADREGDDELYAEELADIVIRVLDHAGTEGIDLEAEVERKMEINEEREYKHGKEY
ncbi:nucleotide pyrophosphohydrolase, MazG [Haloarcula virus HVTV-2]|uniref:MazG-like protein n=1 Tax=Haloarcula vallismortis tailed virus 1 TaxID=1262528 RepID=L7TJ47_9CAUD|nr:pyrophosphatase [Haloarcula vallismortis tailed virus 1]AGC34413.1 MazG-like protein [Haloarcula vallismortis tailed virus 1]UBF22850.1 nucleotide pyrophosphohydrolase, MazG [Haloarcula virus HVTV-2]